MLEYPRHELGVGELRAMKFPILDEMQWNVWPRELGRQETFAEHRNPTVREGGQHRGIHGLRSVNHTSPF